MILLNFIYANVLLIINVAEVQRDNAEMDN